jgi:nucleotide-binding universal stress UspA family protein
MAAGARPVDTDGMSIQLSHSTPSQAARTVVAGYDGSREARHALAVAAERAGPGGTVVVVHATPPTTPWLDSPFYADAVAARMRREDEILEELQDLDLGDVRAAVELVEGSAREAILRAARSRDAAEIVVGSRGRGTVRALLGSVSQDVARHARRPVVIVSPAAAAAAPGSDGCATREREASERAIPPPRT